MDYQVEEETRAQIPAKQGTSPEQTSALEESIYKISGQLSTITRNQKYFRTRENRNFSTVRSTEGRIVNFSLIQCVMVICMGGLQVFVVRFFFQVRSAPHLAHGAAIDRVHRAHARAMYKWFMRDGSRRKEKRAFGIPDGWLDFLHCSEARRA